MAFSFSREDADNPDTRKDMPSGFGIDSSYLSLAALVLLVWTPIPAVASDDQDQRSVDDRRVPQLSLLLLVGGTGREAARRML